MNKILSELKDAPEFTLEGKFLECKVIDVYDGDTVTIIFPFENNCYKKKCRLFGIDTPEKRTKNLEEKKAAIIAKEFLEEIVLNKIVWIKFEDWDKYGRLMGHIYKNKNSKNSINNMLVENGFAYKYDGGTKKKFEEWYELKNK